MNQPLSLTVISSFSITRSYQLFGVNSIGKAISSIEGVGIVSNGFSILGSCFQIGGGGGGSWAFGFYVALLGDLILLDITFLGYYLLSFAAITSVCVSRSAPIMMYLSLITKLLFINYIVKLYLNIYFG